MTRMTFEVYEDTTGWFVSGANKIGPFFSKQRAVDLAEGMVSALHSIGEDAVMVVAEARSFAPRKA